MKTDEILRLLEHDPQAVIRSPEVRAPGVFHAWIRRVLALTSANPLKGLPHVETAKGITVTSCDVVQCFGVEAAARRNLGELDKAQAALDLAFTLGQSCAACEADFLRRRAHLLTTLGEQAAALAHADAAIEAYLALGGEPNHDLHGHGLAHAQLDRGSIRQYFGFKSHDGSLIQAAFADYGEALALTDPRLHQQIHFDGLLNLGVVLRKAGGLANLLKAEDYLRHAWRAYSGKKGEATRERAYLDWQSAMVRLELLRYPKGREKVTYRPFHLRESLTRSRDDFLTLNLPHEASGATSDLAQATYLAQAAGPKRSEILKIMGESIAGTRAALKRASKETQRSFRPVWEAMQAVKLAADADVMATSSLATSSEEFNARLRGTIKRLREVAEDAAPGKILPGLLSWDPSP